MHRHLVEQRPFKLHVASDADFSEDLLVHTPLRLPYLIRRLRKSRFGPRVAAVGASDHFPAEPDTSLEDRRCRAALPTSFPMIALGATPVLK